MCSSLHFPFHSLELVQISKKKVLNHFSLNELKDPCKICGSYEQKEKEKKTA